MEYSDILTSLFALIFVLSLVGLVSILLKKYGKESLNSKGEKRLSVVESLNIDGRRKLMIIKRDDKEHLILTSLNNETVIETDIKIAKKK